MEKWLATCQKHVSLVFSTADYHTVFQIDFIHRFKSNVSFTMLRHFQMRTFLQIWSQKNPVQELRIVPTNLEESLYPREQCVRQRLTWRYVYQESLKDSVKA